MFCLLVSFQLVLYFNLFHVHELPSVAVCRYLIIGISLLSLGSSRLVAISPLELFFVLHLHVQMFGGMLGLWAGLH